MSEHPEISVFLSYSRDDLAFAEQLAYSLKAYGVSVAVDHAEIQGGEHWQERLRQLILAADHVVFVLSPSSAGSQVCRWEVDQALRLEKRLLPVLPKPIDGAEPHPALAVLNYIFFYPDKAVPDSGFGKGLATLIAALSQDIEWIRDHTRLIELAERWEKAGRNPDLLLRGTALEAMQDWRTRRPAKAPALLPLQQALLDASEAAERAAADARAQELSRIEAAQTERGQALERAAEAQDAREHAVGQLVRRTIAGIVVAAALTAVAIGFAILSEVQKGIAEENFKRASLERELQGRMLDFARNRSLPEKPFKVHQLSARYEGIDSDHVSTDLGGGHFYGIFRIRNGSNMMAFLNFLKQNRGYELLAGKLDAAGGWEAANVADQTFVDAWKKLAREPATAEEFKQAQIEFVKHSDYKSVYTRLARPRHSDAPVDRRGIGINVLRRSIALQSVIFSVAVQYGPRTSIPVDAVANVDDPSALTDRELIERIYAKRDKPEKNFPRLEKISKKYIELLRFRSKWEMEDAIHMLDTECADASAGGADRDPWAGLPVCGR